MPSKTKAGEKPAKPTQSAKKTPPKPAAAKPAKSAASATKPVVKKAAAPKASTSVKKKPSPAPGVSPEQRGYYVEVAAYYIAERRGFSGGSQLDDWVQAEKEIDRLISEGILKP